MVTRLQKIFWSILCGASLGIGGCGGGEPEYGAPIDVGADTEEDTSGEVEEDTSVDPNEEEPSMTDYGPAPSP